jgi:hypothetical protein
MVVGAASADVAGGVVGAAGADGVVEESETCPVVVAGAIARIPAASKPAPTARASL